MRIPVAVWQFDDDYSGALGNDAQLPISEMWVKTHFGPYWMSRTYDHPLAPSSIASVEKLIGIYDDQGIGFVPWCEPRGLDVQGEIDRGVDVMTAMVRQGLAPRLVMNVESEPTPYFWKGTSQTMQQIISGIRSRVPGAWIGCWQYQTVEIDLDALAPLFDALITEDYWTDFRTDPATQLERSRVRLSGFDKPIIYSIEGNGTAEDTATALRWLKNAGAGEADIVVWKRGNTSAANWDVIRSFDMTPPPPPPKPGPDDNAMSPGWELRVGLASNVADAVAVLTDSGRVHAGALASARDTLTWAVGEIDKAGQPAKGAGAPRKGKANR